VSRQRSVKVNIHAKWNLVLNNARNLQADLGAKNVEIEIVAYGAGRTCAPDRLSQPGRSGRPAVSRVA